MDLPAFQAMNRTAARAYIPTPGTPARRAGAEGVWAQAHVQIGRAMAWLTAILRELDQVFLGLRAAGWLAWGWRARNQPHQGKGKGSVEAKVRGWTGVRDSTQRLSLGLGWDSVK